MTLYAAMRQIKVKPLDVDLIYKETGNRCNFLREWEKGKLLAKGKGLYSEHVSSCWGILDDHTLVQCVSDSYHVEYDVQQKEKT